MCSLETFKIDLKGMKTDEQRLEFSLDNDFFKTLNASEVNGGVLHVSMSIRKAIGFYEIQIHTEGMVTVPCDICLEDMEQPIETDNRLLVKLGTETNTEDDDVVIVDENEGILDTSWLIYEFIALAIPIKHVHAPGKCNSAMTQKLQELSGAVRSGKEEANEIDPRWEALTKLNIKD
ncbi:MAG: DUF177 domain-containing protein [Prevotella sp.]|nr:DUF177 domain-containing protein [Prevotella sp.]